MWQFKVDGQTVMTESDDTKGSQPETAHLVQWVAYQIVESHDSKFLEHVSGAATPCSDYCHPPMLSIEPIRNDWRPSISWSSLLASSWALPGSLSIEFPMSTSVLFKQCLWLVYGLTENYTIIQYNINGTECSSLSSTWHRFCSPTISARLQLLFTNNFYIQNWW